ncbi:MAG: DUF3316 domain-containing protein [Tannerella sp.]|jgi:hypothetical protein|nr:DUF3316 domain-containing protein [Tannerella sp.]
MKKTTILLAGLGWWLSGSLAAQTGEGDAPYSVNEGTMIGIGQYNLASSYVSPPGEENVSYTGIGLRTLNERMKLVSPHFSLQQILHIDLSMTKNSGATISALSGIIDYSYGYHYRFCPAEHLKLLVGPSLRGMCGFIYNTQSANNSTAINMDMDLNLSAAALYTLYLRDYPLTLRYQADLSSAGILFAPDYGQSYYEIFGLGNMGDVVRFSSFHNKLAIRNYLTLDIPVWKFTIRTGYMNNLYSTDINKVRTHHFSHSFMIGLVKEFVSFKGKELKKRHMYKSAYY